MTGFATAAVGPLTAEPHKRVNYTFGLVLGVDEFQQDQLYHAAGRRWHNSLLHGYGTVWGLGVRTPAPEDANPEIRVQPGVAIDPCGREICVPDTMCVRLTGWLDRHRDTLEALFPGGGTTIPLAVVLCYRECPDDVVPIPGEPCRTQEDAMQPSRLRDSFELRLALREEVFWGSPPAANQTGLHVYRSAPAEEAAVRAFGQLLSSVQLVTVGAPGTGLEDLLRGVRALAGDAEPSPPIGDIVLAQAEASAAYHEAFRVWAVEVRPQLRAAAASSRSCRPDGHECCVLLAEVDLPVTDQWAVAGTAFEAVEDTRPVLLHTRLLQEWLAFGRAEGGNDDTFVTIEPITADTVRVWLHYPQPLDVPVAAIDVYINGGSAEAPAGVEPVAGSANSFDVELAGEPGNGAEVELRIDLSAVMVAGSTPEPLAEALHSAEGGFIDRYGNEVRAYTVFRVLPAAPPAPPAPPAPLPPASGDVSGTYPALTVTALQTRPVAGTEPALNHYLRWDGVQWAPHHVGGFVIAPAGRYTVVAAGNFEQDGDTVTADGPVYNGLTVQVNAGRIVEYLLSFREYRVPTDRHTYIVHAALHAPDVEPVPLAFGRFGDDGVTMMLLGERVDPQGRLIIEIHRIG